MILNIIGLVVNVVGFCYLSKQINTANSNTKETITEQIRKSTEYIKPKEQIETRAASKETTETYKETYI